MPRCALYDGNPKTAQSDFRLVAPFCVAASRTFAAELPPIQPSTFNSQP